MNKSVFDKAMENGGKLIATERGGIKLIATERGDIKLIATEKRINYLVSEPSYATMIKNLFVI